MKARRCFVFLLSVLLLLAALPVSVSAAGDPVLEYEVLVDGLDTKEAEPGDIVTVTLFLQRTDADEAYTMYAMQSELRYDCTFFEVVEDSVYLYDGVRSTDIAVGDPYREFYMNFVSFSGGVEWQPRTRVGSFQLRVIGTTGVSTITNEDFLVSIPDGTDSYECESNVATVILTSDCTVKFETNGGSEIEPVTAIYGEKLTRPEDPVREGKVFAGWFKDIHLTEEWDFENDTVPGNMTLYAKWIDEGDAVPTPDAGGTEATPEPEIPDEGDGGEDTELEGGMSCFICGRETNLIPGIPLCWQCLLMIIIALLLFLCLLEMRRKNSKEKKGKHLKTKKAETDEKTEEVEKDETAEK